MRLATKTRFRARRLQFARHWPAVGLLLVSMLVGHDALMTAEAGHLAVPGQGMVSQLYYDGQGALDHGSIRHPQDRHQSHPEKDCGVNANAGAFQGSRFEIQIVLNVSVNSALPTLNEPRDGTVFEPGSPPSVRRALLQVYRI